MRRSSTLDLMSSRRLATLLVCALASSAAVSAQYRAPAGSLRVKYGIEKLQHLGSVLMIAAHPDDENTAILAYFAQGRKMRTGYLSLTRGEGGQNLIGSEQGDLMGLIRTQELLAARRVDGAEQFFSRAIDFGFSKTADETLAKWNRNEILSDTVWVIRRFQPDVILLRFSGTPRDGHGHHQSSAILGKEAFTAAADPARFPEQLKHVKPWQAKRILFNVFTFGRDAEKQAEAIPDKLTIDVGQYDPTLGLSYGELAGISRSQHRSQGMGASERKGAQPQYLTVVGGEKAQSDVFDGVDTSWSRVPGGAPVAAALEGAAKAFRVDQPEATVPALIEARRLIARLDRAQPWVTRKLAGIDEVIADAAGVWVDLAAPQQTFIAGGPLKLQVNAVKRSRVEASLLGVAFTGIAKPLELPAPRVLEFNRPVQIAHEAPLAAGVYNQPFWLRAPAGETRYRVDDPQLIGLADTGSGYRGRFRLLVAGETIEVERDTVNRYVDPVRGELTRPIVVAPPVLVSFAGRSLLFPSAAAKTVDIEVRVQETKTNGAVRLDAPTGWRVEPASRDFSIEDAGGLATVSFTVTPPAAPNSRGNLEAVATVGGTEVRYGTRTVDYEHIPPQTVFREARAAVVRTDARTLARRVGYFMGAGDDVPAALRQLGVEVEMLTAGDLTRADLARYDAIVTGVRAYNVSKELRATQPRLLEYVEKGGTLIVQYNVTPGGFMGGNPRLLEKIGPYPMELSQERVTVEDAPIQPTKQDHFLLQAPNRIAAEDYADWVQERGLYFATSWDARYQPLWEIVEPGEKPKQGGTLYARHGRGVYIFTPMAWFRQLPAGVPGAYRIFANFLSAGQVTAQ